MRRRVDADRKRHDVDEEHREEIQQKRQEQAVADHVRDRLVVLEGIAKVAVHEAGDPDEVLLPERLIEPVLLAQELDLLVRDPLAHRLDLGHVGRKIVARRELDDDEDEDADPNQRPYHDDETADEKSKHAGRSYSSQKVSGLIDAEIGARVEVVGGVLGHVLQLVRDDHQLLDARHDADREYLIRPERQDLVPHRFARRHRRAQAPFLLQRHQLLHGFELGLFAHLATGLCPKPPRRPLELVGRERREFGRAHLRLQHRVLQAPPHRHLRLASVDAAIEDFALRRLDEELYADLAPVVADQLEHVSLLGLLACGLDDDLQRLAVRHKADAVAVTVGQADPVQKLIGQVRVVLQSTSSDTHP